MTDRPDPWRLWVIALLVVELVAGLVYGALLWMIWNMDFGDDATGRGPSWSAGPLWLTIGIAACAALWTAAIVLNARRAPAARVSLAVVAVTHLAIAASVPLLELPEAAAVLTVVGVLSGAALIATVAVYPGTGSPPGRRSSRQLA